MSGIAGWEPATEAEVALYDALIASDQERYFRALGRVELLLPVSADAVAGRMPMGWATWTANDHTHLLAFTSNESMRTCLAEHVGGARRMSLRDLAGVWPNNDWWLAVNPGLPIEGYLPAWFVAQLARGDARLPRQASAGPRDRLERVQALERAKQERARAARAATFVHTIPVTAPALPGIQVREQQQQMEREEAARQEAARLELARAEIVRQEAARAEAARTEALRVEQARMDRAGQARMDHGEQARIDRVEQARVEQARVEQVRAEQVRAEQVRAEQVRAEQVRAEQVRAEQVRAEQVRAEEARVEQARAEQTRAEQVRAEQVRADQARAEQARAEQARAGQTRAETARADGGDKDNKDDKSQASETGPRHAGPAPAFVPANSVEEQLFEAAEAGNTDAFLSTLLLATVLIPKASGTTNGKWRPQPIDGEPHIVCYTSTKHLAESLETIPIRFIKLISEWPDPNWSFAVNPGTPVGATLPGGQLLALANWAAEVGLGGGDDEEREADTASQSGGATAAASRTGPEITVLQKTIASGQVGYYLDRGYDRVTGFVHRAHEVGHLKAPAQLCAALGLDWAGSPFAKTTDEVYLLRWSAYRPSLYRIPYGGQNETAMRAMEGWVIERAPFRGNGFAPGETTEIIAEFKVDSVRLPHGTRLLRLSAGRGEELVAILDVDGQRWLRIDGGGEGGRA